MALFVLLIVGVIVAQTWIDFRDESRNLSLPDWAKGTALSGVVAALLTAAASFASYWLENAGNPAESAFVPDRFWPELAFVASVMAIMIAAIRKHRIRVLMLFVGLVTAVFLFMMRPA